MLLAALLYYCMHNTASCCFCGLQDVMQWLAESHSTIFLPKEQYLPAPPEPVAGGAPA
jgi:hypothetical protein